MKRVITTALALSLLAGAAHAGAAGAVVAQQQQQQRDQQRRDDGPRPDRGAERGERWQDRPGDRGGPRQPDGAVNRPAGGDSGWNRGDRPQPSRDGQPGVARPDGDRDRGGPDRRDGNRDDHRPGGPDRDRGRDDNRWNDDRGRDRNDYRWNDNRGRDQYRDRDRGRPHYDRYAYRPSYRAPQRYRAPVYAYPRGWYARSWSFGDYLPGGWYGSPYYLDAWRYGLPQPPIGCEWVRVGGDAILVDIWSGQVLSVWRDLFW